MGNPEHPNSQADVRTHLLPFLGRELHSPHLVHIVVETDRGLHGEDVRDLQTFEEDSSGCPALLLAEQERTAVKAEVAVYFLYHLCEGSALVVVGLA